MSVDRRVVLAAIAMLATVPTLARAEGSIPFSEANFQMAVASGKPILVEISAPWCPTCKAQKAVLADLLARPDFQDVLVIEVDFDSQKDVVRALGAQVQSTLIAMRGTEETGRLIGATDPGAIEALLRSAV